MLQSTLLSLWPTKEILYLMWGYSKFRISAVAVCSKKAISSPGSNTRALYSCSLLYFFQVSFGWASCYSFTDFWHGLPLEPLGAYSDLTLGKFLLLREAEHQHSCPGWGSQSVGLLGAVDVALRHPRAGRPLSRSAGPGAPPGCLRVPLLRCRIELSPQPLASPEKFV